MSMQKEIMDYIRGNNLSPFVEGKRAASISPAYLKTKDARKVFKKILSKFDSRFFFNSTKNILEIFVELSKDERIELRQDFFKNLIELKEENFLNEIEKPQAQWKPNYSITVATEDEKVYSKLKKLQMPVYLLHTVNDVNELAEYDVVQAIEVENFLHPLEQMDNVVILDYVDDVYLERYLEQVSGWKKNIQILKDNIAFLEKTKSIEVVKIIEELEFVLSLFDEDSQVVLDREKVEAAVSEINKEVSEKVKDLTIKGEELYSILASGKIPEEISSLIDNSINKKGIDKHLLTIGVPVKLDEEAFEELLKKQESDKNTTFADKLGRNASRIRKVGEYIQTIDQYLIYWDFVFGTRQFIQKNIFKKGSDYSFPEFNNKIEIKNSYNIFLAKAEPISFLLDDNNKCSILTGANSGGKTTLVEHVIQLYSLFVIGMPVSGKVDFVKLNAIYYFAKNKGSLSKGAFETLLTHLSKISADEKTLILADEIEAVTEPGAAAKIISSSTNYFISKKAYMIIATHLGYEIQETLPDLARIDGIEAQGLDEKNNLIVDHNPVLGKIANSTPELIIERLAKTKKENFFKYIFDNL